VQVCTRVQVCIDPGKMVKGIRARAGVSRCLLPHKRSPGKRGWIGEKEKMYIGVQRDRYIGITAGSSDKNRSNKLIKIQSLRSSKSILIYTFLRLVVFTIVAYCKLRKSGLSMSNLRRRGRRGTFIRDEFMHHHALVI